MEGNKAKLEKEKDEAEKHYGLGIIFANGWGVEKDDAKAFKYFETAAELNYDKAQYSLAVMYDNGKGVEEDPNKAYFWYNLAAHQGHPKAQYNIGVICAENGEEEEALQWYTLSAQQGFAEAQFSLGEIYELGGFADVDVSIDEAVLWYQKAAAQGHTMAQQFLGNLYGNLKVKLPESKEGGTEEERSLRIAAQWFIKAATEGKDPQAAFSLGKMYKFGRGVPLNYLLATKWLQMAMEEGYPEAEFELKGIPSVANPQPPSSLTNPASKQEGEKKKKKKKFRRSENKIKFQFENSSSSLGLLSDDQKSETEDNNAPSPVILRRKSRDIRAELEPLQHFASKPASAVPASSSSSSQLLTFSEFTKPLPGDDDDDDDDDDLKDPTLYSDVNDPPLPRSTNNSTHVHHHPSPTSTADNNDITTSTSTRPNNNNSNVGGGGSGGMMQFGPTSSPTTTISVLRSGSRNMLNVSGENATGEEKIEKPRSQHHDYDDASVKALHSRLQSMQSQIAFNYHIQNALNFSNSSNDAPRDSSLRYSIFEQWKNADPDEVVKMIKKIENNKIDSDSSSSSLSSTIGDDESPFSKYKIESEVYYCGVEASRWIYQLGKKSDHLKLDDIIQRLKDAEERIRVWYSLRHPKLFDIFMYYCTDSSLCLVMEEMKGYTQLSLKGEVDEHEIVEIIFALMSIIVYLHGVGLVLKSIDLFDCFVSLVDGKNGKRCVSVKFTPPHFIEISSGKKSDDIRKFGVFVESLLSKCRFTNAKIENEVKDIIERCEQVDSKSLPKPLKLLSELQSLRSL